MMTLGFVLAILCVVGSMRAVDTIETALATMDSDEDYSLIRATKEENKDIPYALLRSHPKNPRSKTVFESTNPDYIALKKSFLANKGFLPGNRIVVRPDPNHPGEYQILKGHRRSQIAFREMGMSVLPCVVYHGLSDQDALALVFDQQTGLGLTEPELLEAYKTMLLNGFKRGRIVGQLKLTDADVTKYNRLVKLPEPVQQEWAKVASKDPIRAKSAAFNPIGENLKALEKAVKTDEAELHVGAVEDGPRYKEALASLVAQKASPKVVKDLEKYRPEDISRILPTIYQRWPKLAFCRLAGENKFPLDDIMRRVEFANRVCAAIAIGAPLPTDCSFFDFGPNWSWGQTPPNDYIEPTIRYDPWNPAPVTTDEPTSVTTDVPTTDEPTSVTTDVPTTDEPTSVTTDVPTTDEPTTDVPTTDVPTTKSKNRVKRTK